MLHFMHTLMRQHKRVNAFIFGTQLTNITRALRKRDVDEALDAVADAAEDWSGGTRIADSIGDFNRNWSRVLAGSPMALFVTDGLEKQHDERLPFEIERLQKSCHRLVWLNPLLRFEEFSPKKACRYGVFLPMSMRFCRSTRSMPCRVWLPGWQKLPRIEMAGSPTGSVRHARSVQKTNEKQSTMMLTNDHILMTADKWRQQGHDVALAVVIHTWGPRHGSAVRSWLSVMMARLPDRFPAVVWKPLSWKAGYG